MRYSLLILFFFISLTAFGQQDSGFTDKKETTLHHNLVFQKNKNSAKTFSIPLNGYFVYLKPKQGKRIMGYISNFYDSVITFRTSTKDKATIDKMKKLVYDYPTLSSNKVHKVFLRKLDSLQYSDIRKFKVSEIKWIRVNYLIAYPSYRWIIGGSVIAVNSLGLFLTNGLIYVGTFGIPTVCLLIGSVTLTYFLCQKTLNLQHVWHVNAAM